MSLRMLLLGYFAITVVISAALLVLTRLRANAHTHHGRSCLWCGQETKLGERMSFCSRECADDFHALQQQSLEGSHGLAS